MRCPYCDHSEARVIDSRDASEGIRRRRECLHCGLRFSTMERVQAAGLLVVKRDGRREEFNREKVRGGVLQACAKRPVSSETVEKLVSDVERDLEGLGRAEVPSALIGQMVVGRLRFQDHVAYVRFASVYHNFQDIESFAQEVESLRQADGEGTIPNAGGRRAELQAQLSLPFNGDTSKPKARRGRRRAPTDHGLRESQEPAQE